MLSEVRAAHSISFIEDHGIKRTITANERLNLIEPLIVSITQQLKDYEQLKASARRDILIKNSVILQRFFLDELRPIPCSILIEKKDSITHIRERIELQKLVKVLRKL